MDVAACIGSNVLRKCAGILESMYLSVLVFVRVCVCVGQGWNSMICTCVCVCVCVCTCICMCVLVCTHTHTHTHTHTTSAHPQDNADISNSFNQMAPKCKTPRLCDFEDLMDLLISDVALFIVHTPH
jgi:hypothetical protein